MPHISRVLNFAIFSKSRKLQNLVLAKFSEKKVIPSISTFGLPVSKDSTPSHAWPVDFTDNFHGPGGLGTPFFKYISTKKVFFLLSPTGGQRGNRVFFGWVCAVLDSQIWTPF